MPKFLRALNIEKMFAFFFQKVKQAIYSSSPISILSFRVIAQIDFEISCLQDFITIFFKGV